MDDVTLFERMRERLSHSLLDGRLLTAAGPAGEAGLRRLLGRPMLFEEFSGRLRSLFRVGSDLLHLRSQPPLSELRDLVHARVQGLACADDAVEPGAGEAEFVVMVREIAGILRSLGQQVLRPPDVPAIAVASGIELDRRIGVWVGTTTVALSRDVSDPELVALAKEYWEARIGAEEDVIAWGMFVADRRVIVPDAVDEVFWTLRGFDEVAEVAIATGRTLMERRADCERVLGCSVERALGDMAELTHQAVRRVLAMKG